MGKILGIDGVSGEMAYVKRDQLYPHSKKVEEERNIAIKNPRNLAFFRVNNRESDYYKYRLIPRRG
ncbi:hypothetical protein AM10699_43120 [Acaryochloris marina MBIC10699]|nr:hypothetical protein AM10699_43120 [Acaryochloris marina MBIC10699]